MFDTTFHGLRLTVDADDPRWAPQLATCLPPEEYRSTSERGPVERRRRLSLVTRCSPRHLVLDGRACAWPTFPCTRAGYPAAGSADAVEREIDRWVADASPFHVALHAGAVQFGDAALLVAGRSGAGKTTLTAALVRAGGVFLSDDLAMVDGALRVHPYPRKLRWRTPDGEVRLPIDRIPGCAAAEVGRDPVPVRWIVVPTFRSGARFQVRGLRGWSAVLALLEHTMSVRHAPGRALERLGQLTEEALVVAGGRGDADEAAHRLVQDLVSPDRVWRETRFGSPGARPVTGPGPGGLR